MRALSRGFAPTAEEPGRGIAARRAAHQPVAKLLVRHCTGVTERHNVTRRDYADTVTARSRK